MSILRVVCANPACGTVLRIQPRQAGKRIRCPACKIALIAPHIPGGAATADGEADAEDANPPVPVWKTLFFVAGLLTGLVLVVLTAVGFELWLYKESLPVNSGKTADLLISGTWKVHAREPAKARVTEEEPVWAKAATVWTFFPNGKCESGPLRVDVNRYDRKPANGFRTWTWSTDGNKLKMESATGQGAAATLDFAVGQEKDKLLLTPSADGGSALTLVKTEPPKTFPDLRVVFYAGVAAPMLLAFLLAWLISREVFYSGCLRFALGWPLTVLLGVALGAGAGYLLDVLNDQNHAAAPYWMMFAFLQGAVGLVTGLGLAVLSCLRPS